MSQAKEGSPMMQELPPPPVPDLAQTLERYLAGLRAVIPAAQYERTRQLVEQFCNDPGSKLQAELIKFAENVDNWVTHFWLDDMYLKNPIPLPVNSNPFFLFPKQNFHSSSDQFRFAAKFILYALDYKKKIDSKSLSKDVIKVRGGGKEIPLCMKTYANFFSSYRRPGENKDELYMSEHQGPDDPWHIIVACKNQFFTLQVKAANSDEIPSEDTLAEQLRLVSQMAKDKENIQPPVGLLTTEDRQTWARIRNKMMKSKANLQSLQAIENCLLVLCLGVCSPNVPNYSTIRKESATLDLTTMAAHLLHGSGTDVGTANRWYDKFLQLVVTRDGVVGFVGEHSASEGITIVRFIEGFLDILSSLESQTNGSQQPSSTQSSFRLPTPLNWEIDDEVSLCIQEASKKVNKLCSDVDLFCLRFSKYGREFIKSHKISPDAFIQIALQLTFYKVHRKLVSTYESASLRRFRDGRVDSIRSVTAEALEWVKVMCDAPQVTDEVKVELFKACIKKQVEIMSYTVNGEGPDNHLLALRELAKSKDYPDIPLFQDKSYWEYLNFRLSTSQISVSSDKYNILVGYGPVVPDGYGCCYLPFSNRIDFCISSFFSSKETSSDFFAHSLEGSLLHMEELCLKIAQMEQQSHN
ncbi:choline O-acetyltransferase isoform X2 [Parasteatoda tepidariorum]|uniref:choline O-acetyltransferase isoform X2 n=1 Tax=Parasteatoda tepidariorum TaxID=114398 RepID=UPI0039BC2648